MSRFFWFANVLFRLSCNSPENPNSQFATPRLLPWKGQTSPLPYTAAARRNLTRELFTEDRA